MTEKLFYSDPYMREFDAEVTGVLFEKGVWKVAMDRTAFYPEGGGQPADRGVILKTAPGDPAAYDDKNLREAAAPGSFPSGSKPQNRAESASQISVTEVHEKDGIIWHTVALASGAAAPAEGGTPPFAAGETVRGIIDWERRFDHMQQHSGEHIVSGMICEAFCCDNVGFHMGADTVTIDYNAPVTWEQILAIEKKANEYIWENHDSEISVYRGAELESVTYRSKKELTGDVRIVSFPGADTCACCGTHVKKSGEVGIAKFLSAVKFREGTRFEVCFGRRAYRLLSDCFDQNRAIGNMMNAKITETADVVKKHMDDIAALKVSIASTEGKYFKELSEKYRDKGDTLIITDGLTPDGVRKLAVLAGSVCNGTAAVFSAAQEGSKDYKYAIVKENGDISEMVRSLNTALSGRGGGKNGFAQGSACASRKEIRAFFDSFSE